MTRSLKHKFFSFELGYFRNPSQLSLLVSISSELKIAIAAYEVTLTLNLLYSLVIETHNSMCRVHFNLRYPNGDSTVNKLAHWFDEIRRSFV